MKKRLISDSIIALVLILGLAVGAYSLLGSNIEDAVNQVGSQLASPVPLMAEARLQAPHNSARIDSPPPAPSLNTEEYDSIVENRFMDVAMSPLSTLSIDVDTASYANVRRMIEAGRLPPKGAVRLEEMINYFSYRYPEPEGDVPLAFTTELADCPWSAEHDLLLVGIQARRMALEALPPNNLVFLIDVSGSMNNPNKLPLLVSALRLLVGELRREDRVAIVVYAGAAGLVLPSTPGTNKSQILAALDRLRAGGSTAGAAGIELAYRVAEKHLDPAANSRVILATDGDFNVGASSQSELVSLIENKRQSGIYLTVLGFGSGNYSDARMERLANRGNGNYAYIDGLMEAQKVLVNELGGTLTTVADDVKIQIEFNPAEVTSYRLLGYENRVLRTEDFADDTKDAGELGVGHQVTVLYELVPAGAGAQGDGELKYQTNQLSPEALTSGDLATIHFRYKRPGESASQLYTQPIPADAVAVSTTSDNFRFATAVAAWGMLLRESQFRGTARYKDVIDLARAARSDDPFGYRAEFLQLVRTSQSLAKTR